MHGKVLGWVDLLLLCIFWIRSFWVDGWMDVTRTNCESEWMSGSFFGARVTSLLIKRGAKLSWIGKKKKKKANLIENPFPFNDSILTQINFASLIQSWARFTFKWVIASDSSIDFKLKCNLYIKWMTNIAQDCTKISFYTFQKNQRIKTEPKDKLPLYCTRD